MNKKSVLIQAITSPITVVCICLLVAATCFAFSDNSIDVFNFNKEYIKPSKDLVTHELGIVEKYNEIDVNRGVNVTYRVTAGTPTAEVTATKNLIDYVNVYVKKGTLKITIDDNIQVKGNLNINVIVSGPAIGDFEASSGGQITIESPLTLTKSLDADASSAGYIIFKETINAAKVSFDASSAANITAANVESKIGEFEVSSGAEIKVDKIISDYLELDSSSAAKITIKDCVLKNLDASASSGGRISIAGVTDAATLRASSGASVGSNNLTVKSSISKTASSGGRISTK